MLVQVRACCSITDDCFQCATFLLLLACKLIVYYLQCHVTVADKNLFIRKIKAVVTDTIANVLSSTQIFLVPL